MVSPPTAELLSLTSLGDASRAALQALQAPEHVAHARVYLQRTDDTILYIVTAIACRGLPSPTAELLSLTSLGDAPRTALQALQAAYSAAVLAFDKDSEQPRSTGVAIFFPMQVGPLALRAG